MTAPEIGRAVLQNRWVDDANPAQIWPIGPRAPRGTGRWHF
jgi:hypothetical protein